MRLLNSEKIEVPVFFSVLSNLPENKFITACRNFSRHELHQLKSKLFNKTDNFMFCSILIRIPAHQSTTLKEKIHSSSLTERIAASDHEFCGKNDRKEKKQTKNFKRKQEMSCKYFLSISILVMLCVYYK